MENAARRIPVWLIVVYVLSLATILGWPFIAFMSVFAFDAPGSAQDPSVWLIVGLVLSYPLVPLVGVTGSFLAYRRGLSKLAYALAGIGALPLAAFIVFLIALVIMNAAILLGGKL